MDWFSIESATVGGSFVAALVMALRHPKAIGRLPFLIAVGWYEGRTELRGARRSFKASK